MRIVLLGAPGAGKGTQAQLLEDSLGIPKLSTGDMLRAAMAEGTEVGKTAESYVNKGNLVPDELVVRIVEERITRDDCDRGFILDGFPRTLPQAEALDKMLDVHNLTLDHVICLEVDEEEIVRRRGGRLMAPGSGRIYHSMFNPPKVAGKCDVTGEDLVQREDDKEEVVRHRLKVYREQTAPVKSYYEKRGMLTEIDGAQPIEQVAGAMIAALKKAA